MKRENFKSRLGFILVSAGCAIGIGNVWRFPYVAGQNGGGVFVLFYLLFLLLLGAPVLTMELAVGRASGQSSVKGFKSLEKPGQKWHWHGWLGLAGCYLLMMYYTTVAGWMLGYFFKFAAGQFGAGMDADAAKTAFSALKGSAGETTLWMAIVVVLGFAVCSAGIQKGLERISKWMMTALLLLIVVLAVHSCTLSGAKEGLSFYLLPDFSRASEIGLLNVITAAMNQAFFTLSLGIGSMHIFGSYMSREHTLGGESVRICALDTFVAMLSGLIIFPACFSFGIEPNQGSSLIFITLPNVFTNMAGGRIWGALFFLFMTFASFTTVIAVFENLIAGCMENFGWARRKSTIINCIFILIASMPCILGYSVWSDVRLIKGLNIPDTEDFLVSNLLLPAGSMIYLLFCTSKWGWGFDKYFEEVNTGSGLKIPRFFGFFFKYIIPVMVLAILIKSLFFA